MSAPVSTTYMGRLHKTLCEVMIQGLKGEPRLDQHGVPCVDALGSPLFDPPKPALLREIREFLKDNGVDQEPLDGTPIAKVTQLARQYDHEQQGFLPPTKEE